MEVACGKCGARGRVSDAQIAAGPVAVRCSACGGVMNVGEARSPDRADAWDLDSGQGAQGPYRIGELVALWRADKITWNAKLWRDGDPEWSPARGHSAFIDAIFVHDERSAGANEAPAQPARAGLPPPPERAPRPGTRLPPLPAHRPNGERTSPAYTAAAAEVAASDPRERTPHDSLAPFERVARQAGKRWPFAIVAASGTVAAAVVVWAVTTRPDAASTVAAASAAPTPSAHAAAPAVQPSSASQRVAVAPASGEVAPTAVPAARPQAPAEGELAAVLPAAEAKPLLPAAEAKPLAAAIAAPGTRPARPSSGAIDLRASETEDDADEASTGESEQAAVATASEPSEPARRSAPDFLTAAEPLPNMPTTREIATAMRQVAPAVRACAESSTPTTVYVTVAITGASGRVGRVNVPQVSGSLESCITTAVRGAKFPAFDRPELELRFPFLISQ